MQIEEDQPIDIHEESQEMHSSYPIDVERDRFPYCIVWTPIPMISWILPFIGHMGIANSEGIIYDFAGPYFISVDDFSFGRPTRYIQLDPKKIKGQKDWDEVIEQGREYYCSRMVSNITLY
jgi:hypothetical protein